jgi:hypothetical protein
MVLPYRIFTKLDLRLRNVTDNVTAFESWLYILLNLYDSHKTHGTKNRRRCSPWKYLQYRGQGMQHEWRREGMRIGYWWESQMGRDHWEDQDVDGWTILKWILER